METENARGCWGYRLTAVVYVEGGNANAAAAARNIVQNAQEWEGVTYASIAIDLQPTMPPDPEHTAVRVAEAADRVHGAA